MLTKHSHDTPPQVLDLVAYGCSSRSLNRLADVLRQNDCCTCIVSAGLFESLLSRCSPFIVMPPRRAASGRAAASASRRVSYKEEDDDEDNVGGSTSESEGGSPSEFEVSGQSGQEEEDDDEEELDSATSEEEEESTPKRKGRQRGRQSASSAASAKRRRAGSAKSTPVKRQKVKDYADGEEDGEQPEFVGGEVMSVTKLVPPPREKHEPGKLGRPVIDFLAHLADPKYNDREWFHTNERVWKWVKEGELWLVAS